MGRDCGPSDRNNCEFDGDCNTYAPRDCGYNLRTAIQDLAVGSGDGDSN